MATPGPEATRAELDAIHTAPEQRRPRLLEDFHTSRMDTYRNWAIAIQRRNSAPRQLTDDIVSEVAAVAVDVAANWPDLRDSIRSWEGWVSSKANTKVREWLRTAAATGLSGATTLKRRQRALDRTRSSLRQQWLREPTDEEVVEQWNDEADRRYSNPSKHGLVADVEDINVTLAPLDMNLHDLPFDARAIAPLEPHETKQFVDTLLDECHRRDHQLGDVAEAFYHGFPNIDTPTARDVSDQLDLSYDRVRRLRLQITDVAHVIMYRQFGLTLGDTDDATDAGWLDAGLGPATATDWQDAGYSSSGEAAAWASAVGDPRSADLWRQAGFTAPQARRWADANFTPAEAARWDTLGLTADAAARWRDAGFTPKGARDAWRNVGFDVEQWPAWANAMIDPPEAKAWDAAGHDPTSAAAWKAVVGAPAAAQAWATEGFTPDMAARWAHGGWTPKAAAEQLDTAAR